MTEPSAVTQFRTMLLACATISGQGITTGRLFYPKATVAADDSTTPAVKPFGVLAEISSHRKMFLEPGVLGLPEGTLTATFYFSSDVGTVEDFARSVCSDLLVLATGLPIRSTMTQLSSEPEPGAIAANQTIVTASNIVVTITVEWGLSG